MEKRVKEIICYINKYFDNREISFCQLNNYSKLSSYIKRKNIIVDDEICEILLDKCDKLNNMFKILNLSNLLLRLEEYQNLSSLLEMYCIKNNVSIGRDVEVISNDRKNHIDLLKLYISEINDYELLSNDEEKKLACGGSEEDRLRLIEHNLRLVIPIARSYVGHGLSLSDLIQAGNEGLVYASLKFDQSKNYKFCTYAVWWIRQFIDRAVAEYGRCIRVPVHIHESLIKMNKASRIYESQNDGRSPSDEELSCLTGISLARIKNVRDSLIDTISLNTPVYGEDRVLEDIIEDNIFEDEGENSINKDKLLNEIIQRANLTDRELYVIKCRYGFFGRNYSLEDVGKELGCTRERIRQIEKKVLMKLQAVCIHDVDEEYLCGMVLSHR